MIDYGTPINATNAANPLLATSTCRLVGFYVNSTSSGTIVLYDSATAATNNAKSGTITPAVGWHFFPAAFANGLYAVLGGTINVTFMVA